MYSKTEQGVAYANIEEQHPLPLLNPPGGRSRRAEGRESHRQQRIVEDLDEPTEVSFGISVSELSLE